MGEEDENNNPRHAGGQPTKYRPEYVDMAYKFCLLKATDKDLARFFEVCEATVNNWKINHPEFLEALKAGKEIADSKVAQSLYDRATGLCIPETKVHFDTDSGTWKTKNIKKYYPPDTAAAFIWLKNRAGWSDKSEILQTVETRKGPPLTVEEIQRRLEAEKEAGTGLDMRSIEGGSGS